MLPYTVGSSESSELSDPYGVWPCESLPNVGRSNCVWSSWVDCSGTVGSGGMLGMEGASGAGAACGVAGRPECTGRLERLASQVLRTDRSEFRKERHTGCRTECWWLPGLGRSAIRVCGGHCRSRRRHCRCRSGCRIRISGWRRNSRCVRVGDRCRSAVRGVLCGCGRWHARGWGVAVAGCRIVEACAAGSVFLAMSTMSTIDVARHAMKPMINRSMPLRQSSSIRHRLRKWRQVPS